MTVPDDDARVQDEEIRERSAERRAVVTPTPRDVRHRADTDPEVPERGRPPSIEG
ncbi:hypothetical protein [Streptacidiphilus neutrinimicus]|uniref:hypothetical protein n=1 Tax=Streptacidiphilus neutrinimicus TaxID=105420 RepID=UPI000A8A4C95|nr:hypothetical protein [Streptacidiphilus neutrinimicus]